MWKDGCLGIDLARNPKQTEAMFVGPPRIGRELLLLVLAYVLGTRKVRPYRLATNDIVPDAVAKLGRELQERRVRSVLVGAVRG